MAKFTDEQTEAINLEGCNILVSAGAGSGKTAVLSERVLRKIKNGISIDNLLVLTFTNAAASEMKSRIREKVGKEPDLKEEFEKVEASYITTFDSFTLAIVKKYHYLKNLDSKIDICDSSIIELKKQELLDEFFENLYISNDEDFKDLLKVHAFKDDKDIKNFIKQSQKEIDLLHNKHEYINTYMENFYSEEKINEYLEKYKKIIKTAHNNVCSMYENLAQLDYEFSKKLQLDNLIKGESYTSMYNSFPSRLASVPRNSDEELKEAKENLAKSIKQLKEYFKYENLDEYVDDYMSTKKYVNTLINLIKKFDTLVDEFKIRENLFEFLDIEKMAIDILKENEDVRNYYKNRFNEILIDEYQDTSDIQEIFINLISDNNAYMVGDIKQSIYRFRNANPDIFRDKFNNYGKNINGKRIDLNKNFRSREEVLSNINLIFNYLMDNEIGGAEYRKEHQLIFGNLAYNNEGKMQHSNDFELIAYEPDEEKNYSNDEIEIFTMANDILKKMENKYQIFDKDDLIKRDINFSDFAILIDNSRRFDLIKKIFTYKNIPLMTYKDESIKDAVIIKIIKNILIFINKINKKEFDKKFSYAYTSIARSFLFSTSDEEIINSIKNKKINESNIYNICKKIEENIENKNIYIIVNEIIEEFDFQNKLIEIGSIQDNTAVIEYILNLSKNSSSIYTFEEFINYLDNITYGDIDIKYSLSKGDNDSVKLMTIHRSKGLEYPVVYFPFLSNKFNDRDILTKYAFNKNIGIIIPAKKEKFTHPFTKEILKNEFKLEDISEKLRLFYVALTRAKEKYIFIMNYKNEKNYMMNNEIVNNFDRMKYKTFGSFLESVNTVLTNYVNKINILDINLTKEYDEIKKFKYKTLIDKSDIKINIQETKYELKESINKTFSTSSNNILTTDEKNYIKEGLKIHKILEEIDLLNPNFKNLDQKYEKIIKSFIETNILDNAINIYKEYEFIDKDDNKNMHGIIDLLIEKENEFIIVDYKLKNINKESYKNQLNGYKEYLEKLTNKKVNICLYSLLKNEFLKF